MTIVVECMMVENYSIQRSMAAMKLFHIITNNDEEHSDLIQ